MKRYTYTFVTRHGKKDGRDWKWEFWPFFRQMKPAEPKVNQTIPAQFETELLRAGENSSAVTAQQWKKMDETLKPRYCQARNRLKNAIQRCKKESSEAKAAMLEYEAAEKKFQDLSVPALDPRWRIFWLVLIGIAEFPLNGLVFSIFGAERAETYIMASAMCLMIPIAAHFFGQSLRQEHKTGIDKGFLIILPLVILGALAVIAILRAKFFEAMKSQKLIGVTLTPEQATVLFIIINVALFFVAIIVSYEGSHPNHSLYNTLRKRLKESLKRFRKESKEAERAAKELERIEHIYHRERQLREKSFERFLQEAHTTKESTEWLVSAYRRENIVARRGDIPDCFKAAPAPVEIPGQLLHLDWDCDELRDGELEEAPKEKLSSR